MKSHRKPIEIGKKQLATLVNINSNNECSYAPARDEHSDPLTHKHHVCRAPFPHQPPYVLVQNPVGPAVLVVSQGGVAVTDDNFNRIHVTVRRRLRIAGGGIVVQSRVLGQIEFHDAPLYGEPPVRFRAQQIGRLQPALVPHLRARVNVKTHVVVTDGRERSAEGLRELNLPTIVLLSLR